MSKKIDTVLAEIDAILDLVDDIDVDNIHVDPDFALQIESAATDIGYAKVADIEADLYRISLEYLEETMIPIVFHLDNNREQLTPEQCKLVDKFVGYFRDRGIDLNEPPDDSWEVTYGKRADRSRPY